MTTASFIFIFHLLLVTVSGYESHHRHRHSRSHGEYSLDRLMNKLDNSLTSTRATETSSKPARRDILDDVDEPVTESGDPGNSLWGDPDDSLAATRETSTYAPLDSDRWNMILSGKSGKDLEKAREALEDEEDDAEERSAEEEDLQDQDQSQGQQADSYKPSWNSRSGETLSEWKLRNLGDRKSVNNLFQVYRSGKLNSDNKDTRAQYEMYEHNKKMAQETLCRVPRPKVVRVADVYPSTSKMYVPACTLLHQCSDDTGCCGAHQRCGPKATKRIELYFYTMYIGPTHQRNSGLEKLPFYNHTECGCQDRLEEIMPRDDVHSSSTRDSPEPKCKCPSEYTVRRLSNGFCSCDCFDKQRDCIKYKKGKAYFNHNDRLCIELGTCQVPSCDFGGYMRSSGRCPRKHEKYRTWSRFN